MTTEATQLAGSASSPDPGIGLAAVASLRTLLESIEELQVRKARALGWSWQDIAIPLRISKQAVHKKYSGRPWAGPGR